MASNTTRSMKVLVSNATAANTGTSAASAVDNDVILVDKTGVQLMDEATLQNNKNADIIRVLLGTTNGVEQSTPIQVRNVRGVTIQSYVAPVQHSVKVLASSVESIVAGKQYSIKITFKDEKKIAFHLSQEFYTYTAVSGDTAATVLAGLKAKIDSSTTTRLVATIATNDLVLTGKAITAGSMEHYQFQYFDVALRRGFIVNNNKGTDAMTTTAGKIGNGVGQQVYDMERLSTHLAYKTRASFPNDEQLNGVAERANKAGMYNIITIEHGSERSGDLTQTFKAPVSTVIAFATTDGTSSAKQTAFVEKLTSILESAGVYVSDVVPSNI
jgi:hypothetical protein